MSGRFDVRFTHAAREDLLRLHEFLAQSSVEAAEQGLETIERAMALLEEFPWSCRRSSALPGARYREMLISFGSSGYVALFEIEDDRVVTVLAVRHQRESDFH